MGTAIKHPVPKLIKPSFVIFDIRALTDAKQSVRMSKITNDCLTRSGTGCFIAAVPITRTATVGIKSLNVDSTQTVALSMSL